MQTETIDNIHNTVNPSRMDHLHDRVIDYVRDDYPTLNAALNVEEALQVIRNQGIGERIIYFYIIDDDKKLLGIVPTRRLLTSMPNVYLRDIMNTDIISVPHTAEIMDICEKFVMHKLLAFPVLDDEGRMLGVVDVGMFTEETLGYVEHKHAEDLFQLIGFGITQLRGKSAFGTFRFRFPWLLATMTSGTICALLTGLYETTLANAIVLAFFITLVLALGESVSIQSMTVALQKLHVGNPSFKRFMGWLRQEGLATFLLGAACGTIIGLVAYFWRGEPVAALVIGVSIVLSVFAAGLIGLTIPTVLHAIHEDSKIAAGPITLAITDILTLVFYFNIAVLIFGTLN
ncbi:MAG TPA: magnesium transporter [Pyrinomonadaceae bacterium]|nr:magnesium transporter [Pyrinomonadaceae bacterium]HMP66771.1 magnesium transporter [Pyrinomonadaceae bacterium]